MVAPKKKLKKIYKEIVKKTHPDKIDSERYLEIYITSKKAFEEKDWHSFIENNRSILDEIAENELI